MKNLFLTGKAKYTSDKSISNKLILSSLIYLLKLIHFFIIKYTAVTFVLCYSLNCFQLVCVCFVYSWVGEGWGEDKIGNDHITFRNSYISEWAESIITVNVSIQALTCRDDRLTRCGLERTPPASGEWVQCCHGRCVEWSGFPDSCAVRSEKRQRIKVFSKLMK